MASHNVFYSMSKEESTLLKGVAILFMIFLHLFSRPDLATCCHPLLFVGGLPLANIVSRSCSPVGIFLILSGYGLSYVYRHGSLGVKAQSRRLFKLYVHYWLILLIFVTMGSFISPDKYPGSFLTVFLNVTSISSSYNVTTWFLFPYMLLSVTAYGIFKIMDRLGNLCSFVMSGILYLVSCFIISRYIAPNHLYAAPYAYVLTYLDLLFSFVIGAIGFRIGEKHGLKIHYLEGRSWLSCVLLGLWFCLHFLTASQSFNPIYEAGIVVLVLQIPIMGLLRRFLLAMGHRSMVMWMTHTFFCNYLFHDFIFGFRYPLAIFAVLVAISYFVAIPIMFGAKKVINLLRV
jgi:hypothetical protein